MRVIREMCGQEEDVSQGGNFYCENFHTAAECDSRKIQQKEKNI